jgi:hypothetical protein
MKLKKWNNWIIWRRSEKRACVDYVACACVLMEIILFREGGEKMVL